MYTGNFDPIVYPGQEVSFLVNYDNGIVNPVFNIYITNSSGSTNVGSGVGGVVSGGLVRYTFTVPSSTEIGDVFQIIASGDNIDDHIIFSAIIYLPIDSSGDFSGNFESIIYPGQDVTFLVNYETEITNPDLTIFKSNDSGTTNLGTHPAALVSANLVRYTFTVPVDAEIGETFQIVASSDDVNAHIVFSAIVYLPIDNVSDFNESLNQISLMFKDHSNNAISNVKVNLDTTTRTAVSNSSGVALFYVEDDDDYVFNISPPPFYQTPDKVTVTVTNQDVVEPVVLDPIVLEDGKLCNALFRVIDQHNNPVAGAKIHALIKSGPAFAQNFLLNQNWVYTTDQNGEVIIPLIRATSFNQGEGIYKIKITSSYKVAEFDFSAPDAATTTVTTSLI